GDESASGYTRLESLGLVLSAVLSAVWAVLRSLFWGAEIPTAELKIPDVWSFIFWKAASDMPSGLAKVCSGCTPFCPYCGASARFCCAFCPAWALVRAV